VVDLPDDEFREYLGFVRRSVMAEHGPPDGGRESLEAFEALAATLGSDGDAGQLEGGRHLTTASRRRLSVVPMTDRRTDRQTDGRTDGQTHTNGALRKRDRGLLPRIGRAEPRHGVPLDAAALRETKPVAAAITDRLHVRTKPSEMIRIPAAVTGR
jgi:hypothetical protein